MSLTAAQQQAIAARGNVLVMAGAGTGKTSTLVARCIDCLSGPEAASLNELLIVTFTEAAAAEARQRIRAALDAKLAETGDEHWAAQLALFEAAAIGTLHSFCYQLVREHFYQLGLDPQITVLDEGQARLLAEETLTELLDEHYAGKAPEAAAVQQLIETYAAGRDEAIRRLVLRLHHYAQTRPDPQEWFAAQVAMFREPEPKLWAGWLLEGLADWRQLWLAELEALRGDNSKAGEFADLLRQLPAKFDRAQAAMLIERLRAVAKAEWPKGKKTALEKPLKGFLEDLEFLVTLAPPPPAADRFATAPVDPLAQDWTWCRPPMLALLRLTEQFTARYGDRKRNDSVVDFHDLEQFSLQLLWTANPRRPSPIAEQWRAKLRYVFVDEYQDINAAQDQIIAGLSREGAAANRFLVGDIKQSIYRFRLAEPGIFRGYARTWEGTTGQTIPLAENFRSRATILDFANAVFTPLMRETVGGVSYDQNARLIAGLPATLTETEPDVEMLFRLTERKEASAPGVTPDTLDDLQSTEREALHIALRLRELKASGRQVMDRETKTLRALTWSDMAVLMRAPSKKAEGYAKQFERASVPLKVERGGFFDALEISDLLNLLRLLDNPLQDVPLLAVLRSPLVGLSLEELAHIRLTLARGHFWTALMRWHDLARADKAETSPETMEKVARFLTRFATWRHLARHAALSKCLDAILAETHYAEWLQGQERGHQRHANVQRLLVLTEQYDQFQRQGLFRFLRFIEAQTEADAEPEVAPSGTEEAVRLMSIHQSKGLEFPVVVVADLGKAFNLQELRAEIILDEQYGLCPQVRPPRVAARYPSVAQWLAGEHQKREALGEELRLLYVALTRAREKLILVGSLSRKKWEALGDLTQITPLTLLSARNGAEWLRQWHTLHGEASRALFAFRELEDSALLAAPDGSQSSAMAKELPPLDATAAQRLQTALTWQYPFADATRRAAKTSVTALRRTATEEREDEGDVVFSPPFRTVLHRASLLKLTATEIGNAHHKFLEHVNLSLAGDPTGLREETKRLRRERLLTSDEVGVLDFTGLEKFWNSEVGRKIRAHSLEVKRELPFTARFAPGELDALIHPRLMASPLPHTVTAEDEFVIVQGVADLVVLLPEEIWLLDFKTDQVTAATAEAKKNFYIPQLALYARALARIHDRPVTHAWLHFLTCNVTFPVATGKAASQPSHPAP